MNGLVCPVCGCDDITDHDAYWAEPMYVCNGCCETLWESELVTTRTNATRIAYARLNGHPDDYENRYDTEEN